jgi:hydroxymethylbilane synthase
VDATLLAAAGLDRLGRDAGVAIPTATMLPAPSQGAVGVEVRADDVVAQAAVAAIGDPATFACVMAERGLLAHLGADCHSPVAALASLAGETLSLRACLFAEDGSETVAGEAGAALDEPVGASLAAELLGRAPDAIRRLFNP